MKYSIIGTGNMAWFLARRLKTKDYECVGVYGRNAKSATMLANEIYANTCGSIADVKDDADICIMAVSDQAIGDLAKFLSLENSVLAHTAGSISLDITANAATDRVVIWPVYSILRSDLPVHRDIPCAWEANSEKAKYYAKAVIDSFTDISFEAKEQQRNWLHLAAVFSNNFINHLLTICEQICEKQGVSFAILQPIIKQTFERSLHHPSSEMQTGPAKRGDSATINKHMDLLTNNPEWQAVYKAMSSAIEKMYNDISR